MNVRTLNEFDLEPAEREARLAEFELAFRYPLGDSTWFRVSHAPRYRAFYESIAGLEGESECFIAEREGRVLGVLSVAAKAILDPASRRVDALYFGDFKTLPGPERGRVAWSLLRRAAQWSRPRTTHGLGVAMEGTSRLPDVYTGRMGLPAFELAGRIVLLRILIEGAPSATEPLVAGATCEDVRNLRRELTAGDWLCRAGEPTLRSEMPPLPLVLSNRRACGWLEDTRRAKRLVLDNHEEMVSGHRSEFAFRDPRAGAQLVAHALQACGRLGLPALFLAAPERRAAELVAALHNLHNLSSPDALTIRRADALLFGHALPADGDWWLSTAEI